MFDAHIENLAAHTLIKDVPGVRDTDKYGTPELKTRIEKWQKKQAELNAEVLKLAERTKLCLAGEASPEQSLAIFPAWLKLVADGIPVLQERGAIQSQMVSDWEAWKDVRREELAAHREQARAKVLGIFDPHTERTLSDAAVNSLVRTLQDELLWFPHSCAPSEPKEKFPHSVDRRKRMLAKMLAYNSLVDDRVNPN